MEQQQQQAPAQPQAAPVLIQAQAPPPPPYQQQQQANPPMSLNSIVGGVPASPPIYAYNPIPYRICSRVTHLFNKQVGRTVVLYIPF